MAAILDKPDEESYYRERAAMIQDAFLQNFYKHGLVGNGSQTTYASALYHGLIHEGERSLVIAELLKAIERNGGQIDTGILGLNTSCVVFQRPAG